MPKILVVDDESRVTKGLKALLSADGYQVVVATTGEAGLEADARESPALVILESVLPGMSGLEVCRTISRRSLVPILMLTARGGEMDTVIGLEAGADDYVTKPYRPQELLARIKALLRRAERAISRGERSSGNQLRSGKLLVDLFSRRATYDGNVVPLKPKEFDLLVFLMSHAGIILSRDELLEQVWGYSACDNTRTVAVHISGLRVKLEAHADAPRWIETVRGRGYRFTILRDLPNTPTSTGLGKL